MAYRPSHSRLINDEQSMTVSSLEAVITINGFPVGRAQGIRGSMNGAVRPVNEIGSDTAVELLPGIKSFQGTIQAVAIRYGDLVKRIASMSGSKIVAMSKAATHTNCPPFDLVIQERGIPSFGTPALYSEAGEYQSYVGMGGVIRVMKYCLIDSAESSINVDNQLIMESCQFRYIDEVMGDYDKLRQSTLGKAV